MSLVPSAGNGRVLDFDIENRPLSYWVPDKPTCEITAIASCWTDDLSSMEVVLLAPPCFHPNCEEGCVHAPPGVVPLHELLARFMERYVQADVVTGHYIRMHDLPIINGALYELGMPLMGSKMTSDTKLDMFKKGDLPATQEFLLEALNVTDVYGNPVKKYHMSQTDWREANRLTKAGIAKTKARVASDVYDHIALRQSMLDQGMLSSPKVWSPGGGGGALPGRLGAGIG